MNGKKVLGIIFANIHEGTLDSLTASRTMGSVPFCSRYRLIDFPLSNILNFFASADGIRAYVQWGMGNFSGVSETMLPLYAAVSMICIVVSFLLVKPLNLMLIGSRYAENLGVNIKRLRTTILLLTGIMTALSTSFCGPIAFIGLAVPHLARLLLRTDDFRLIMPTTILIGALVALLCNFVCVLPSNGGILPLNAVTPFLGVPIILYVISRKSYSL